MPVSITKQQISNEVIQQMAMKAFGCKASKIIELTEGFFNIAYKLHVEDRDVILKIAPLPYLDVMTHEKNIMETEVTVMQMVRNQTDVPVPKILYYDNSCEIHESSWFFMECLEGKSFQTMKEQLSSEVSDHIRFEMGVYTKKINSIHGSTFGYFIQKDKQGDVWYDVFHAIICDTYADARRKNIHIPVDETTMLTLLEQDKAAFTEVKTPKLVHWDIWDGNVFVHNNEIEGIIDFERALWADELLEVGFRAYSQEPDFLKGYQKSEFTVDEKIRIQWYDIYVYLINSLETTFRGYDNTWFYDNGCKRLLEYKDMLEKRLKL